MNNIYVLEGEDSFLAQEEIESILEKRGDIEKIRYDLKEVSLDTVLEDLNTYNFFTSKKAVIGWNAYFLTGEKPRNALEQNLDALLQYIQNPSPDNVLILVCKKLDERKAIVKSLRKNAKILSLTIDLSKRMEKALEGYEMSFMDRNYLMDRTLQNPERILHEIEKLRLYKGEDKKITREDIDLLVPRSVDDNIFTLVDAVLKKKKKLAFEIYEDMLLQNEEPMKILVLLANKIRLLYQVKILSKTIRKDEEIGKILGSHPYPVKLAREMAYQFQEEELLDYLDRLAHIDIDVKMGNTYQNIAFEMFLFSL